MKISLNGEEHTVEDGSTVQAFVAAHSDLSMKKGIAIAVNEQIVAKSEWKDTHLMPGDNIFIVQATQGG